ARERIAGMSKEQGKVQRAAAKVQQKVLALASIERDVQLQPREVLSDEVIADYAEQMQEGAKFPPVVAFFDGERYWLADGWHRLAAAERLEFEDFPVEVHPGGRRDAMLHAAGANVT